MAEQNYDFRARMLEVHRKDRRVAKPLAIGQTEINSQWTITSPAGNRLLAACALDLKDYFDVSMVSTSISPIKLPTFRSFMKLIPHSNRTARIG